MTKYYSCAETAKLVRQALKESFPKTKFRVRSSTYSGGASIRVSWVDGPLSEQVKSVTSNFEGAYFDGMTDYKGYNYNMVDREKASFGADYIFVEREQSDELIQRCIDYLCKQWQDGEKPTVEQYRKGALYQKWFDRYCSGDRWSDMQSVISKAAASRTGYAVILPSETVKRVRYLGDDGYGYNSTGKLYLQVVA